jgi:hypothetical protein
MFSLISEITIAWTTTTSTTTCSTRCAVNAKRFPQNNNAFHTCFTTHRTVHHDVYDMMMKDNLQNGEKLSILLPKFACTFQKICSCVMLITLLILGDGNVNNNNNNNNNNIANALMTDNDTSRPSINLDSLQQSLVSPTSDKPQIIIRDNVDTTTTTSSSSSTGDYRYDSPTQTILNIATGGNGGGNGGGRNTDITSNKKNTRIPIVEGMVYLQNNNERPSLNDYIVITVSSPSSMNDNQDDIQILAGAKYQVYKAKFPFNFKMYNENLLKGKEQEWMNLNNNNNNDNTLIVAARVCPEESQKLPCTEDESIFVAKGVSKLLMIGNLPGGDEGQTIRTPVSLQLISK